MVPNSGDYYTLEWADHGKMLVHNARGVELMTNACRHRQAIIVEGKGNARNLRAPCAWLDLRHGVRFSVRCISTK